MMLMDKLEINILVAEVEVTLIENKTDWNTGRAKESKIKILVDADKAEEAKKFKLKDLAKISRDKKGHAKQPSYVLFSVGSTIMESGETSIPSYLYGIKPGTRKITGTPSNNFTSSVYKGK